MNQYERRVLELIQEHSGALQRSTKHLVWKFPSGAVFVQASTPSDQRACLNNLRDLRRVLGIDNTGKGEGERRPTRNKPGRDGKITTADISRSLSSSMAEALALAGTSQAFLEEENERLNRELVQMHAELANALVPCACLWCRIRNCAVQALARRRG